MRDNGLSIYKINQRKLFDQFLLVEEVGDENGAEDAANDGDPGRNTKQAQDDGHGQRVQGDLELFNSHGGEAGTKQRGQNVVCHGGGDGLWQEGEQGGAGDNVNGEEQDIGNDRAADGQDTNDLALMGGGLDTQNILRGGSRGQTDLRDIAGEDADVGAGGPEYREVGDGLHQVEGAERHGNAAPGREHMGGIRPNAVSQIKVDIGEEAAKHGQKHGNGTDANGRFGKTLCVLIHYFVPPFRLPHKGADDDAYYDGNAKAVFLEPGHLLAKLDAGDHDNGAGDAGPSLSGIDNDLIVVLRSHVAEQTNGSGAGDKAQPDFIAAADPLTEAFHAGSEQHNDQQPAAAIEGHGEPGIGHSVDIIAGAAQLHAVGSGTGGSGGQLGGRRADHGKAHPGKRAADNGDHADGADEAGQGRADGSDHAALEALGAISFG